MGALLKTVGYGFLLVVLSPLIVLALALLVIYIILDYLILELVSIPMFFKGKSFKHDDALTLKLKEKIANAKAYQEMKEAQVNAYQQSLVTPSPIPTSTIPPTPDSTTHSSSPEVSEVNAEDVTKDLDDHGGNKNE
jgi:hypothetical protein